MAKAHTLSDNFNDNSINPALWKTNGAIEEVNQRIEIRPLPSPNTNYGTCESVSTYDLTNSYFQLEVSQVLPFSGQTYIVVEAPGKNALYLTADAGFLRAMWELASVHQDLAAIPYDPVLHRWWRVREDAGVLYWETSANGKQWNTLVSKAYSFDVTACSVWFTAREFGTKAQGGMAVFESFNTPAAGLSRRVEERRLSALGVREEAAELAAQRKHAEHANNNDEVNYPSQPFIGNYSKGLKHDSVGDPDPVSYGSLLRALESRDPKDFEAILIGGTKKFTNPQSGLTFDLEGPDAQSLTVRPAPRFDSAQTAAEAGELYWMALARDVAFIDYASQASTTTSVIAQAISSLNGEFSSFGGTLPVTAQNLFRGVYPGEQVGPYVSQFLLKGNADPRKPDGQGRDADEGFITYGGQVIDQRQWTVKGSPTLGAAADYLTVFNTWLEAQNGKDFRGGDQFDTSQKRFIRNLRDGSNFVHFDQVANAWWNATFLLLAEPTGNQLSGVGAGRPQVDMEFAYNKGNPYDAPGTSGDSRTQVGFGTFGPIHVLQALIEVLGRATRAVWWQKWGVHRRLRPEEYGGRVDNQLNGRRSYPLHASITTSLSTGGLAPYFPERYGSYLLPQAFPEGAPTHPAYGAGHATASGACATILKAFFDESTPIENPRVASADGLSLVAYTGADAAQLTVGGELNKLAGNIALFRNAGGVHWRSDYTESLPLGEAVAIGLLQEMSLGFNEDDAYFQLTKFDGTTVRIHHGIVELVLP